MTNHPPTKAEIQASIKQSIDRNPDRSQRESDIKSGAAGLEISVDEYRCEYEKAELKASFVKISNTHDRLQHEYDLTKEAKRLKIPVDDYRRYYEQRKEVSFMKELPDGANPIKWVEYNWRRIFPQRQFLQQFIFKNGATIGTTITAISAIVGVWRYVSDAPQRDKQAQYQAWQIVNSARVGEPSSAGRIEALEDLVKYGVDLAKVDVTNANLGGIKLPKAELISANLSQTNLNQANLNEAKLQNANLDGAKLVFASLRNADLQGAKLRDADISADLDGANLAGADIGHANLGGAININPEQIKKALNWAEACYDPDLLQELKITENPLCNTN